MTARNSKWAERGFDAAGRCWPLAGFWLAVYAGCGLVDVMATRRAVRGAVRP